MDLMGGAIYSEYLLVLAIFPFFANYPEKDDDSYDIRWIFLLRMKVRVWLSVLLPSNYFLLVLISKEIVN